MSFCSFVLNAPKNCNLLTELVYLKRKKNGKETNKDDESPFTNKKMFMDIYRFCYDCDSTQTKKGTHL